MSEPTSVKAAGFSFMSPEVIILFADHENQHLHVYPSEQDGGKPRFVDDERQDVLLLLALDKLEALIPWSERLHRVLVFGKAEDLLDLGLPLLDAKIDEDGRVVPDRRQNRNQLLARIEEEAVELRLDQTVRLTKRARRRAREAADYEGPTFRELMKKLRSSAEDPDEGFSFASDVGIPAIRHLMGDTSQAEFKAACVAAVERSGIPEGEMKRFFRWVIGKDGIGPELGKAVDALLYPDDDEEIEPAEAAERFSVSENDVLAVAKVYKKLRREE